MTEISTRIMLSENHKKVDIEKLVTYALRKNDYMYDSAILNSEIDINFTFHFIPESETPVSYDSIIGDFDTENEIANDPELELKLDEKKLNSSKIFFRAPNNTLLFRNWIETNKIEKFTIQSFVSQNQCINKESAVKIISHQIHKKNLLQIDNDTFKVVK